MARGKKAASSNTAQQALAEAEALQQTAERKRGKGAIAALQQAADVYEKARQAAGPWQQDVHRQALLGIADVLHQLAETTLAVCSELPDTELSTSVELAARESAVNTLQQAVAAFEEVIRDAPGADASVGCGNALAASAELQPAPAGLALLARAEEHYNSALQSEEDAGTWSNLGDTLVSHAERSFDSGDLAASQQLYNGARQAYDRACSLSSSDQGDDLPGLLHNWGVGLHSHGTHTQDPGIAFDALEEAVQRLQAAIDFNRGDVAPLNALGDVLSAACDWRIRMGSAPSSPSVPAGGMPLESLQQSRSLRAQSTAALLHAAIEQGYNAALRIDSANADAWSGMGEAYLQLGRLHAGTDQGDAHFSASVEAFARAVQHPSSLGGFSERCGVRYNYACACCLAGKVQDGMLIIQQLLSCRGIIIGDVLLDADFAALRPALEAIATVVHNSS